MGLGPRLTDGRKEPVHYEHYTRWQPEFDDYLIEHRDLPTEEVAELLDVHVVTINAHYATLVKAGRCEKRQRAHYRQKRGAVYCRTSSNYVFWRPPVVAQGLREAEQARNGIQARGGKT